MLLIAKGSRIVACRWKTPFGEIDIVARRRRALVFVEVKARERADEAAEAVTERTKRRIIAAAELWLAHPPRRCALRNPLRRRSGDARPDSPAHCQCLRCDPLTVGHDAVAGTGKIA
jgi:hypothetical protein